MSAPQRGQYWFHQHPKLTLSLFALFGCIVVAIVAEMMARVVFPLWTPAREERTFWTYDALLGWAHTPHQQGRFTHPDFSVHVRINSLGWRASEYPLERTEKKRMLVLGDSFAWGFGVEQHERFSEILEKTHPEWEIMNASVSGYSTDQAFLFLQKRGLAFKPDVVLLLFHANDFDGNKHAEEYWRFKPFFRIEHGVLQLQNVPVPHATMPQRLQRFFFGRTALGGRLLYSKDPWFVLVRSIVQRPTKSRAPNAEDQQSMHDVTYHLIAGMQELCTQHGSRFVLVSIPMQIAMKKTFLQKLAEEEKILYLPLDAYFPSTTTSVIFPHDPHWNAQGHALAASAIEAFLVQSGAFGASRSE